MSRLEEATELQKSSPEKAEAIYKQIIDQKPDATDKAMKEYEGTLIGLGELYRDAK